MRYGQLSIATEPVSWFQGQGSSQRNTTFVKKPRGAKWPSRDVELMHLQKTQQKSPKLSTDFDMVANITKDRQLIESVYSRIINELVEDPQERVQMFRDRSPIENLDCHHDVVLAFDEFCIDVNKFDYALNYIYVLNNLRTKFNDSAKILTTMVSSCAGTHHHFFKS